MTEFPTVSTDVLVAWVRSSPFNTDKGVLEGSAIPDCFAENRTVFIPKTSHLGK